MAAITPARRAGWATTNLVVIALTLIPVLWLVSLSFKTPTAVLDPSFLPAQWTWGNYHGILTSAQFLRPLANSIGIGLISTFIAVVLASMAAYAIARLRFPGKSVLIGTALLIAMFPADRARDPAVHHRARAGTVQHLARADHPVRDVRPAARHLHAVGVLP